MNPATQRKIAFRTFFPLFMFPKQPQNTTKTPFCQDVYLIKNMQNENNVKKSEHPSLLAKEIIPIAQQAGEILRHFFKKDFSLELKNNDTFDPVTSADKQSDALMRKLLHEKFPDDLILSEENENIPTDYTKRIWMVDPLDGTKDFIKGKDGFAIHIGLFSNNEILFGLVYAPIQNKLFWAEKGKGAYMQQEDDFQKIQVSPITSLLESRVITRSPGSDARALDEVVLQLKCREYIHDSALKVPKIACGQAEAHINTNFRASKWDTLAPQIILEEAGGIMTDLDGNLLDYTQKELRWERSYIATSNKEIHNEVLQAIKKHLP